MSHDHQCHCASGSGAAMPAPGRPVIEQLREPESFKAAVLARIRRIHALADEFEATLAEPQA